MRYLLTIFISVLILAGCQSMGSPGYRIDPQATAQAQWKPGEIVAEGEVYWLGFETPSFYRKFIGITDKGYAVGQDFYADSDNKYTDPYVVMQPDRIGSIGLLWEEIIKNSSTLLDGKLTFWHKNGQKMFEGNYQDGMKQGPWTWWDENGKKLMEGYFQDGKAQGLWTYWYENGQKREEGNLLDDKRHGLWTEWDENGQKIRETLYEDGDVDRVTRF